MELFRVEEDEEGKGSWGFYGENATEKLIGEMDNAGGRLRSEVG